MHSSLEGKLDEFSFFMMSVLLVIGAVILIILPSSIARGTECCLL